MNTRAIMDANNHCSNTNAVLPISMHTIKTKGHLSMGEFAYVKHAKVIHKTLSICLSILVI